MYSENKNSIAELISRSEAKTRTQNAPLNSSIICDKGEKMRQSLQPSIEQKTRRSPANYWTS